MAWCLLLLGGCAADHVALPGAGEPSRQEVRDALRDRIAIDPVRFKLRVDLEEGHTLGRSFSVPKLIAAFERETGRPLRVLKASGTTVTAEGDTQTLRLDDDTGLVQLHDQLGYDQAAYEPIDKPRLAESGARMMEAMEVDPEEEADRFVESIGTSGYLIDGSDIVEAQRLADKMFYLRSLGRLPVAGHRMVFSYATDGSLRNTRGLWPALDLADSALRTDLSTEQVVERAVDVLEQQSVDPFADTPIALTTFFDVEEAAGPETVALQAAAHVVASGPNGAPSRGVRYLVDVQAP